MLKERVLRENVRLQILLHLKMLEAFVVEQYAVTIEHLQVQILSLQDKIQIGIYHLMRSNLKNANFRHEQLRDVLDILKKGKKQKQGEDNKS